MLNRDDGKFLSDQSTDDSLPLQNRFKYSELCKNLDGCKISNSLACMTAIAVLKDLKLQTSETLIDSNKIKSKRSL